MLISLESEVQHLSSLLARLIQQSGANSKQSWEGRRNNLIKVRPAIATLVPEHPANGEQALEARKDRRGIIRIEQLHGDIHEAGPFRWEIEVQDLLQDRDELSADLRLRRRQHRQQTISESRLLVLGDRLGRREFLVGRPALGDAVLQVHGRWVPASAPAE